MIDAAAFRELARACPPKDRHSALVLLLHAALVYRGLESQLDQVGRGGQRSILFVYFFLPFCPVTYLLSFVDLCDIRSGDQESQYAEAEEIRC